jgi:hypothetical protein
VDLLTKGVIMHTLQSTAPLALDLKNLLVSSYYHKIQVT